MSRKLIITLSAIAAVLVVGAVGFGLSSIGREKTEGAVTEPNAASTVTSSGSVQASDGGGLQVQATFDPQAFGQGKTVSFRISMNTHSVELGNYDLGKLSQVTVDQGALLADPIWTPAGEGAGHHMEGTLSFSDPGGLARTAKRVTLEIKGLPGPEVRRFEWQVPTR